MDLKGKQALIEEAKVCQICGKKEIDENNVEIFEIEMWSQHCTPSQVGRKTICVGCLEDAGIKVDKLVQLLT
jgi:hypothetical protein